MNQASSYASRHFAFLQGPCGPFFLQLAKALELEGARVQKINFNAGDQWFWHDHNSIYYNKSEACWPAWIEQFFKQHTITDLALYGDCRPWHKMAIEVAKQHNIKVHVLEEGYLRPLWITYELDGVNANSAMHGKIDTLLKDWQAPKEAPADKPVGKGRREMIKLVLTYYFVVLLGSLFFRRSKNHRTHPVWVEMYHWTIHLLSFGIIKRRSRKHMYRALTLKQPYFLLALQLHWDYQMRAHSRFESVREVILETLTSFASHAPKESFLVVKNHPLDSGQVNYRRYLYKHAKKLGVADRVLFIDYGSLPRLLDKAQGVVTVNSTSGLQAIHHRAPLKLLGKAMYDSPKLVDQKPLDAFWKEQSPVDNDFYQKFRNFMLVHNQINGSFYTEQGMTMLIDDLKQRMLA